MTTSPLREVFSAKFSSNPVEQQLRIVEAFRDAVQDTHIGQWAPGDPIPSGALMVVGVMVGWNAHDQELAACLDEAIADGRVDRERVAIFAADDLRSREAVEAVFPGIGGIGQSPYVALWEDGLVRLVDSGPSAAAFLSDRYGLTLP